MERVFVKVERVEWYGFYAQSLNRAFNDAIVLPREPSELTPAQIEIMHRKNGIFEGRLLEIGFDEFSSTAASGEITIIPKEILILGSEKSIH